MQVDNSSLQETMIRRNATRLWTVYCKFTNSIPYWYETSVCYTVTQLCVVVYVPCWIPSRTVYSSEEKLRWASSRTSRSAWPIGLVCSGDSSSVQVWPHLVRYLVRQFVLLVMFRVYSRLCCIDYIRAAAAQCYQHFGSVPMDQIG